MTKKQDSEKQKGKKTDNKASCFKQQKRQTAKAPSWPKKGDTKGDKN